MADLIIFLCGMFFVPIIIGIIPRVALKRKSNLLLFQWIMGHILIWAVFQFVSVYFVVSQGSFDDMAAWVILIIFLLTLAGFLIVKDEMQNEVKPFRIVEGKDKEYRFYQVIWGIFILLLLFQMVMAVIMTYADGDDAFYIAVVGIAEESNTMYMKLPYTGGTTELDVRYGLAPFPLWIAFIAYWTNYKTVVVAHVLLPVILIPMTYGIYYLIGTQVFRKKNRKKLPLFMVMTQLLVLFGDYSSYTAEKFLIARSRQGKAALGNIIIPILFYILLVLFRKIQEEKEIGYMWWILLASALTAGCLCSTLGAFLGALFVAISGICGAVCYKRFKLLIPMALSCMPAVGFALLYLRLN
ncbi:DUF6077 domain-containing protein [Lachnospiraceae bacterium OttesenSCG-928-D06]|nr:DUF6077 domain-containing protein [Lachnospiraceae bacterium OttesenSCG-928-D06]